VFQTYDRYSNGYELCSTNCWFVFTRLRERFPSRDCQELKVENQLLIKLLPLNNFLFGDFLHLSYPNKLMMILSKIKSLLPILTFTLKSTVEED